MRRLNILKGTFNDKRCSVLTTPHLDINVEKM
nr:MAG TPA: hypothetical protein [Caudoviricetes sp.]